MLPVSSVLTFPLMIVSACLVPLNHLVLIILWMPPDFHPLNFVLMALFYCTIMSVLGRSFYLFERNVRLKFLLADENKTMQDMLNEEEEICKGHLDSPLEQVLGKLERVALLPHLDVAVASALRFSIRTLRSTGNVYIPNMDSLLKNASSSANVNSEGFAMLLTGGSVAGSMQGSVKSASPVVSPIGTPEVLLLIVLVHSLPNFALHSIRLPLLLLS
jgi:hypothetical protein